jgi:hypothetical protein
LPAKREMTLILRTVRTARNPAMHSEACHDPLAGASSRRIPIAHARTSVGRGKGLKAGGLTRRAIILRTNNLHIVSGALLTRAAALHVLHHASVRGIRMLVEGPLFLLSFSFGHSHHCK